MLLTGMESSSGGFELIPLSESPPGLWNYFFLRIQSTRAILVVLYYM